MKKLPWLWLTVWLGASLVALAMAAPQYDLARSLHSPQWPHVLGFDPFGRDLITVVLKGSTVSILFAASAALVSVFFGAIAGTALAVAPGAAGYLAERALEGLLAFPTLLFALAWAAIRGPGWDTLIFALLIGTLPGITRLVLARSKEILATDYVLAARSLGVSRAGLVRRYLLPEVLTLCAVKIPNLFAGSLIAEATLSFLGIGAPVGDDTWGSLLAIGKDYLIEAPHIALGAGIPLVFTVLALQLLSENTIEFRSASKVE